MANILLVLPNYGSFEAQILFTVLGATQKHSLKIFAHTSSLLVDSFNTCWATFLNTPDAAYFVMLHADVIAQEPLFWIDVLLQELEDKKLDVLSVVLPLKDEKGITSTGMLQRDDQVKRLTLTEVHNLPQTFLREDVERHTPYRGTLLVNTGMWIAKRAPWMEAFDGFRAQSLIVKNAQGLYETKNSPEDWDFSLWASEKGLKVAATTIIKASHIGRKAWPNFEVYGLARDSQS